MKKLRLRGYWFFHSLYHYESQMMSVNLVLPSYSSFPFLIPIFLIIIHFGIQKDTHLKECNLSVEDLPIIFFCHPFYSASFSTHSAQLSLLYHFDNLDNFNMALSFSRGVKISIVSGDVGNFTAEIFGFSVSTIKQFRNYPNQQNKSKLQNYTHIQITELIVGFFFS